MLKIIKKVKNPKFLVITPLKLNDTISKETKLSVKRNKVSFDWVSFEGDNNIPLNTELGLKEYEQKFGKVKYLIKIDNDINMDRGLLDEMFNKMSKSSDSTGYCFCSFSYVLPSGETIDFNKDYFDWIHLLKSNYISSNSMIKRKVLKEIGGFVTDDRYVRLLDYALWLKMLFCGFKGVHCDKRFITTLNPDNISARGKEDYDKKMGMINRDFIIPILQKYTVPDNYIDLRPFKF